MHSRKIGLGRDKLDTAHIRNTQRRDHAARAGGGALIATLFAAAVCTATLGAELSDISHAARRARNIPGYVAGALVRVGAGELKAGDIIQGVDSELVQNVCDVRSAMAKHGCGDVRLTIRRGDDTMIVNVRLTGAQPRKPSRCEDGDGAACTALARAHNDDVVLFRQACDLGDGEGCYRLGLALGNTPEGAAAYEQACDAGNSFACTNLGYIAQNGEGMRADLDLAARLYKRGCDGSSCSARNDLGCLNLGRLYRDGIGVKEDAERALALFRLVCDYGSEAAGRACFNVAAYYEDHNYEPHAIAFYQRACDKKDAEACERLGVLQKK